YKIQKVKTVFSFREEYLPEFECITTKIPSIKYSRFRLMPMNGNQAYEVITRTWKSNISSSEAHNIVGFFAREDDKDPVYDMMEIEPSLLSQVCSFIDKERTIEGGDKISADFLTKYPKEKILRSIYNEALAESNIAVVGAALDVKTTRPVNEFVEDRLITDEGYRTKYALTGKDEKIRPGIEVLKSKYFIREDDNSVELTHDVLVPLIKKDREERRKWIALAAAKKKANKRALRIVLLALLIGAAAWIFAALKTQEALTQKKNAEIKIATIEQAVFRLQDILKHTEDSIDHMRNEVVSVDMDAMTASYYADLLARIQNDSIQLASFKKQYEDLIAQNSPIDNSPLIGTGQTADSMKVLDKNFNEAKREIIYLQRKISADSSDLASLRTKYKNQVDDYNGLIKKFDDYIRQVSKRDGFEDTSADDTGIDTNSLHLKLYYSLAKNGQGKVPGNLKIYLIPDNSANKKIISNAKIYEVRCNELNLDGAKDKKVARYKNGVYKFYDVPPGKYFVKICEYYGGYYTYSKKSAGNVPVNWDASPPIR
ncbi:MAG: hypothetical protein JWR72_1616, partial [Flavisolibacter sp.]|nr:hypothetical protein [Flavisolibacter sp.]